MRTARKGKKKNNLLVRDLYPGLLNEKLDPWLINEEKRTRLIEELVKIHVNKDEPSKILKVGKELGSKEIAKLEEFLRSNLDAFVWRHEDMEGIDLIVACHKLNIDPKSKPIC